MIMIQFIPHIFKYLNMKTMPTVFILVVVIYTLLLPLPASPALLMITLHEHLKNLKNI